MSNLNQRVTIFLLFLLSDFISAAQKKHILSYPDPKAPGNIARVFAPGTISAAAIEHSSPAFSPDGKTIIWTIMKMPSYQTRLLEMNFDGKKWSSPHPPLFTDTTSNEGYPNFSGSGDTLYFTSNRKKDTSTLKRNTIWYVTKTINGWSLAKTLDTNTFKKDIYAHSVSQNGNRYFTLGPFRNPDWNIYKADNSGIITPLPLHINSSGYEDGPFIAPDESYLIFESNRPTGAEGNLDLYISFAKKDGSWGEPLNMGPGINTASSERFASVSPDGKYVFFGRNTGSGFDIYWIDAGIIKELRKQAIKAGLL